ncbi:MAG: agmatinase [Candidatus Brocadiaceae bacterium]|nr:agmatinase [Candidatus Brocadiaceae bacterium]
MASVVLDQFLGLPSPGLESADALVLPVPFERTTSYGRGTWRAPGAILRASHQVETFDEETLVDFEDCPRLHTLPPCEADGDAPDCLAAVRRAAAALRGRFVLGLGGEHTVTYGLVDGLVPAVEDLTIVQIDAHADLIDRLDDEEWSHGTVMRRLWDRGAHIVQIGIRSLSRQEHDFLCSAERVRTYFAHDLPDAWPDVLARLQGLRGDVYLTVDVDGLDPSVIPSTGTPQPDGLSWRQTMDVIRAVTGAPDAHLLGADVVEFVPSPHPPGCDLTAARLAAKILAFRFAHGRTAGA